MTARSSPELADALVAVRPARAYVVCATPRSGSTLLCEMLADSGIAGRPSEHVEELRNRGRPNEPREYFADVEDRSVLELLPASGPPRPHAGGIEERLAALMSYATTANGVFGTKVMWSYLADLQERLAELPGFGPCRTPTASPACSATSATSTCAARTTSRRRSRCGAPSRPAPGAPRPTTPSSPSTRSRASSTSSTSSSATTAPGTAGSTSRRSSRCGSATRRWPRTRARVLQETLDFIGVGDQAHAEPPPPSMRRQSGAQSREWADRYRREEEAHR